MDNEYTNNNKPHKPNWKKTIIQCLLLMILTIFIVWLFSGCIDEDYEDIPVDKVLLVYLAGDNNLSGESHDKLQALARGYDGAPCRRILVYKDSRDEAAGLYEATGNGSYATIESYGNENSADAAVFARVIKKAKSMYPKANFNLLVFSHASGWLPAGALANPMLKSVLQDGDHQMEFRDFAAAIPDGMFTLVAFDACHMAGIEVAYQLRNKAKYIIASSAELVSPGFTPVYQKQGIDLITGNYENFIKEAFAYFDTNTGYMRSATLSVIKTEGLEELAVFVKQHCDLTKEVPVNEIQHFDRGGKRLFCDFSDYYSRLLDADSKKQDLQSLIDKCIIWKAATPSFLINYDGFAITTHSGMTGYIPQGRYAKLNENYTGLMWYQAITDTNTDN